MQNKISSRIYSLIGKINDKLFSKFPFVETVDKYNPDELTIIVDEAINKLKQFEKLLKIRLKFHSNWSEITKISKDKRILKDQKTFGIFFDSIYSEVEKAVKEATTDFYGLQELLSSLKILIDQVNLTIKRALFFKELILFDETKGKSILLGIGKLVQENKLDLATDIINQIENNIKKID